MLRLIKIIIFIILFSNYGYAAQQTIECKDACNPLTDRTQRQTDQLIDDNFDETYSHMQSALNPHSVTALQVNLGNVDDTADADKPVSTDQLAALALKADISNVLELDNTDAFTPDADYEPATKKYVDDNAGGAPEGTAVLSTGEVGAVKYLREDGDGTCSWQTPAGSGDVTAAAVITDHSIVRGDGGAKGVQDSGVIIDDSDNITGVTDLSAESVTIAQGVAAQSVVLLEGSGSGTDSHTIVAQPFTADRTTTLPDYNGAIPVSTAIDSSGLVLAIGIADWYAYDPIPIAWMNGGTSEPDALDITTRTPYAYRTFDPTADEDLNFVWFVPSDLSGTTIQFRVKYLVTNATGPSAEGVAFGLSGVSLGDNDLTNAAKGTVVVITDPTITAVQHDILITGWSGDVTITNLLAGEVAEVAFIRDVSDAADTYAQVVGVFAIEIRYVRNVAR